MYPEVSGLVESEADIESIIKEAISQSCDALVKDGAFSSLLIVISKDKDYTVYEVPDGTMNMAQLFTYAVEKHRGATRAYIFITETWSLSLSTENMAVVREYMNNPSLIADNPFKKERLTFYSTTEGGSLSGFIPFERDDSGIIQMGELEFDDTASISFANVADLLLPMME